MQMLHRRSVSATKERGFYNYWTNTDGSYTRISVSRLRSITKRLSQGSLSERLYLYSFHTRYFFPILKLNVKVSSAHVYMFEMYEYFVRARTCVCVFVYMHSNAAIRIWKECSEISFFFFLTECSNIPIMSGMTSAHQKNVYLTL